MEISLNMSKKFLVHILLVVNILVCSGLRSAAREKKAKCPTCSDIVEAFKKVNTFALLSVSKSRKVYNVENELA